MSDFVPDTAIRTDSIWQKLVAAQADMANPVKTKAVKAGARSYNYEVLADVLEIVTDALHAHGLALVQGVTAEGEGFTLRTGIADEGGPVWLDVRPIDFPADPQAAGSKETYARRYALKTAFGLAGVDDDGEAAHQMAVRGSQKPVEARKPATPVNDPLEGWKRRFAALRAEAKRHGLDDVEMGRTVSQTVGRPSTQWDAHDYEAACNFFTMAIDQIPEEE